MKRIFTLCLLAFVLPVSGLFALSGGPDAYGYIWKDSNEPTGPTVAWVDTSDAWTTVTGFWTQVTGLADDNSAGMYPIYFPFHYYWSDYSQLKIGSNGWISFDNVSNIAHCFPSIPTPGGAGDTYLAPFMSDLTFTSNSPVIYPNVGEVWVWTNTKDSAVITYYGVPFWQSGTPDWTGSHTFQVLLDAGDSSITFTYMNMTAWNNNISCNTDIVIGIENSTGNIGLQCFTEVVPAANYAIKFYYPANPLISVKDLTPLWNKNTKTGGEFHQLGLIQSLDTDVKNVGNDTVSTAISVTGTIKNLAMTTIYTSAHTLAGLNPQQDTMLTYTPQVSLSTAGQYYFETSVSNSNDINPANNTITAEINMVDLSNPTAILTYCTGGAPTGSLGWNGGAIDDGVGIYQEPPIYPVNIYSLNYYISSTASSGYIAQIYDDNGPGGGPGTLLFTDTIPYSSVISGNWNTVTLSSPITITSGGYYVTYLMGGSDIYIGQENLGPISRRSYEILSGQWSEYRENKLQDFLIRVNINNYNCTVSAGFTPQDTANVVDFVNTSTGATTFFWDFGDGNTSTQANPTHTYATTGTYTVCLIASSACGADTTCQTVILNCPAPVAAFSYTPTGITLQFQDNSTGSATSWLWDFGDGNTSTSQNPSHTFFTVGTYTVCLTISGPCGTDSSCQTVTVCPLPNANFSSSTTALTASFTNSSSGGNTYYWDFGDGGNSTLQNPQHTYAASGTFTVCLILSNACSSDTLCQQVTVCAPPAAAFNYIQNGLIFDFSDQTPGSPVSWFWDFGDGNTSTQQNPSHTYATQDTFTVCLIVTDSCSSDTTCMDVITTPISVAAGIDGEVQLWPNPAKSSVQISFYLNQPDDIELALTDISGKVIWKESLKGASGPVRRVFDLEGLSSGLYFVKINGEKVAYTGKIVKE